MPSICFYFQIHQPFRLKSYDCFKIGYDHTYEDEKSNQEILDRVADKCYLPANRLLLQLIKKYKGKFRVAFSISGTAIEQFQKYRPEVITSFQALAQTGCVEFLAETYYHSLSYLYSTDEFVRQVKMHMQKIHSLFGQRPQVFRNTELIYNNEIGQCVEEMGFKGMLCEGVDRLLGDRSPNVLYHPPQSNGFRLLLKNYRLSDDIAFRFSDRSWPAFPLTAPKYANWVHQLSGDVVNLFIDYETFGEHQWADSGIFEFLKYLPQEILSRQDFNFKTPSEIIALYEVQDVYDVHDFTSWADTERDLSAWQGNDLQVDAIDRVFHLEGAIKKLGNIHLLNTWSRLLTSDHFYYMCTKHWQDGDVHKYFSPYNTPYDAYINFMNVLTDLEYYVEKLADEKDKAEQALVVKKLMGEEAAGTVLEPSLYI